MEVRTNVRRKENKAIGWSSWDSPFFFCCIPLSSLRFSDHAVEVHHFVPLDSEAYDIFARLLLIRSGQDIRKRYHSIRR